MHVIEHQRCAFLAIVFFFGMIPPTTATPSKESFMRELVSFDGGAAEPRWVAVNDGVMGGRSQSAPSLGDGHLQFRGELSLANNGGFASIRTADKAFDLGGAAAVVMRVRGDGRRYQLRLATDARHRGITVSYGREFATQDGHWIEARVPIDGLVATARGTRLDGPPFDPTRVREIALLIADGQEGPFALDVDWIRLEEPTGVAPRSTVP